MQAVIKNPFYWLIVLLILTSPLSAQKHIAASPAKGAFDEASVLLAEKKYKEATVRYESAWPGISAGEDAAAKTDCLYGWAESLLSSGKTDSALMQFAASIEYGKKAGDYEKVMYAYSVLGEINRIRGLHRKSLEYNLACAEYCRKLGNRSKLSSRYSIIGSNYQNLAMNDSAMYYHVKAVSIKEEIKDTSLMAIAYDHLGFYHLRNGELGKAAESWIKSLEAAEIANNTTQMASSLTNLADALVQDGHLQKARPYAERALLMNDTLRLRFYQARVLNVLADIEEGENHTDQAIAYLREALAFYRERNNQPKLASQYLLLARINEKHGLFGAAENFTNAGLQIARKLENPSLLLEFQLASGRVLVGKEKWVEAQNILKKALSEAEKQDHLQSKVEALGLLAQVSRSKGDFRSADVWQLEANRWQDTLSARQQSEYLQKLEAQFQKKEQEAEIGRLALEKELADKNLGIARSWQHWLIIASLLAFVAALLGFFLYHQKQKHTAILLEKKRMIEKTLAEKELLLREIHHRVKNNLQVVSSLLNLQSRYIKDPGAISAVTNSRTRVRSMALIHQNLYQGDNLQGVDVQAYFTKLLAELFETYRVDHDQVKLQTEIEALQIDVDTVIPIGLIINELVSNSLKYAFTDDKPGVLEVVLKKQDTALLLEVSDTGNGFSEETFGSSDTFGFKLIKTFAAKLEAQFNMEKSPGKTTVRLIIPDLQNPIAS
ncbi:MAG: tetratricopeptide repeat protein [Lewinellaceae bacterium]|nr:tetratricopeptide repeat protein [Saprospiraceae bacterium]MCB9343014.1 tetratricopeptide repeat protein [Lewinellaceae bacterium]